MKLASQLIAVLLIIGSGSALWALQQRGFPRYRREDGFYETEEQHEFAFTRLRYPTRTSSYGGFGGFGMFRNGGWSEDYPKADRQFVQGVLRLTRLDARTAQEVVDPQTDEMNNWPWIYAVNVSNWDFTDVQAKRMRDYLLKGGFLVVDSFHGTADWETFLVGVRRIFPDRSIEELGSKDEIFHVLYDLDDRPQVPGYQFLWSGRTYERDGIEPHWRAIRDDNGRIMIAICYNMHIGDAWEHADDPRYPERFSSYAYRMGINYIMYAMSH
jgi:hypothetical protein